MANDEIAPEIRQLLTRQRGVVSLSQLNPTYLATRRAWLRKGLLRPLYRGAYVDRAFWEAADPEERLLLQVRALQLVAPDAVAYGTTAALAHRLRVGIRPAKPEVVRAPRAPRLANVSVRRSTLAAADIVPVDGLRATTLVRTAIDVGAGHSLPNALVTIDEALRRGCGQRALTEHLESRPSMPGRRAAATAIEVADRGSESPLESLSRGYMYLLGMPRPRCNIEIRRRGRRARVDFLWDEWAVIGECDGRVKYTTLDTRGDALWREKRRTEWLEDAGYEVFRWGFPDLGDGGLTIVERYERAVARQRRRRVG